MRIEGKEYRTIWFENNVVKIIDQTKLPHQFIIKDLKKVNDAINAIKTMEVRGAPLIGATAAYGLVLAILENNDQSFLKKSANDLISSRPTAINLKWAVDRMMNKLSGVNSDKILEIALNEAKDICEEDSVVAIFGQPKSGKSFVTVDLACNIVLGRDWHGHETEQGSVVYLAGEGMRAISRRFLAWQQLNATKVRDAPLLISTRGARLLDDKDHQLLKDTIDRTQDETGKVRMIVVDTLQRNFGAGNENSTEDMSAFIERIDDLRDSYSTCICIVHHTGHGTSSRARGSSVIQASVDWEYRVTRTNLGSDMFVEFSQTLVKDGKPVMPKNFKFIEQKLPFHDMTSGALEIIDAGDMPKKTKVSEKGQAIIDAIRTVQDKADEPATVWLGQAEITKITNLNDSTVKTWLRKLVDQDVLTYEKGKGYQTNEYNSEIF